MCVCVCVCVKVMAQQKILTSARTRAKRRLMKDYMQIVAHPLENVCAAPLEENIFVWHGNCTFVICVMYCVMLCVCVCACMCACVMCVCACHAVYMCVCVCTCMCACVCIRVCVTMISHATYNIPHTRASSRQSAPSQQSVIPFHHEVQAHIPIPSSSRSLVHTTHTQKCVSRSTQVRSGRCKHTFLSLHLSGYA